MLVWRWRMLALLLVTITAGCSPGAARDTATSSGLSTPRVTSPAPGTAGTSPARPAVSSSRPRTAPASTSSAAGQIPPVSARARAAGLIDIRTIVPDAVVDLRYATSDNFVGVALYPADARCLVHDSMAAGLIAATGRLRREGDVLVFWDCYRPHAVQVRMFDIVPNPDWVARPGPFATSHEAARSVDVTLAQATTDAPCPSARRVQRHCLLDMGTDFDDFSPRAYAFATGGLTQQEQANRSRLHNTMSDSGITVYSGEWWHFDGPGAAVERPHLDVPVD
jgi:D-alanyl-D-alanine dipeptidase